MNSEEKKPKRFKKHKWIKKRCYFTDESIVWIDYKDADLLRKFINNQGKILSSRETGTKRKMQRKLSIAIKRARHIGLLPFTLQAKIKPFKNIQEKSNK